MTEENGNSPADGATDKKEGREGLYYLWHLEAIGLFKPCRGDNAARRPLPEWGLPADGNETTRSSRIALIDNGVSTRSHPNFPEASDFLLHAIDFSGDRCGHRYPEAQTEEDDAELLSVEEAITKLRKRSADALAHINVADLIERLRGYAPDPKVLPAALDPCVRFAAHGTACAGLIGAGVPRGVRKADDGMDDEENDRKRRLKSPFALDYVGVNPWARIVPINTVYSPDYWPLIMALIHAIRAEVDVILMPRLVEEMNAEPLQPVPEDRIDGETGDDRHVDTDIDPRWTRKRQDQDRATEKELFEELLAFVSHYVPVVVAAGNRGKPEVEYPASLVKGKAPELIVVGAVNARGVKSSYCSGREPGPGGQSISVFAPSDDMETVTEEKFHLDDMSWRGRRQYWDDIDVEPGNLFSPYGVLTVDIPGEYGYDGDADEDRDFGEIGMNANSRKKSEEPEYQDRSLYAAFGGTSAASAITAGLASLVQHKLGAHGKGALTGGEMKTLLQQTAQDGRDMEREAGIAPPFPKHRPMQEDSDARVGSVIDAKAALEKISS